MNRLSGRSLASVNRESHFTAFVPKYPGTNTRAGNPCSVDSGAPFIAHATSTSGSSTRASGRSFT